ncbi:hypothetical protein MKW94_011207, partial [Papaver nudicaule]|nr:hypothetical protein [Papaver nudicaule]
LKPSNPPKRHIAQKTSSIVDEPETSGIGAVRFECPKGTVPIKRTTKEDLIRAKSLTKTRNGSNVFPNKLYYGQWY